MRYCRFLVSDADDMISSYITKPWEAQSPVSTSFISTTSDLLERSMLSSLFFELFCNAFFHTTKVWDGLMWMICYFFTPHHVF